MVAVFGRYRRKIDFDLILRAHNAFAINEAVRGLRWERKTAATILEFGVSAGAGLINMARIAQRIGASTGAEFRVIGFDTGQGMPPARDYHDRYLVHPRYSEHATWISHMWKLHVLDHPRRNDLRRKATVLKTEIPYL